MNIKMKTMSLLIGLSTFMPLQAQKSARVKLSSHVAENISKDVVNISKKVYTDISLRTFQFLNRNNLTGLGVGVGKSKGKYSCYITPLVGYDTANKKAWFGGFGFIDRKYKNISKNAWLSQELYGEVFKEKGNSDLKLAYTPLKFNTMLSKKVSLTFDPRVAVHINKDGLSPQMETLTTISAPISQKVSGYALFQTYDTTNVFKKGSYINIGINGGIVYNF